MLPYFQWTTISFGPLTLQVWGLFVSIGMALTIGILAKRAKRLGMNVEQLLDQAIWMIVGGFLFARLFHVFFYEPFYYLGNPVEMLKIWHGGLSSFGGVVGAGVGFLVYRIKYAQKQSFVEVADLFAYAALFGWMVGRIGCFMIHDHLGVHSTCPLAMRIPGDLARRSVIGDGRLDMAFMEILGLVPLAILFFVFRKKRMLAGWFTSVLFLYYGVLRFILDFFRATDISNPDARYFGLTPGQYSAIIMAVLGAAIFFQHRRRTKKCV